MKYQRSTKLSCKDLGIRKLDFVAKLIFFISLDFCLWDPNILGINKLINDLKKKNILQICFVQTFKSWQKRSENISKFFKNCIDKNKCCNYDEKRKVLLFYLSKMFIPNFNGFWFVLSSGK